MTVHILATVRNEDLIASALLVFGTVRTGFPTAHVMVHGNNLDRASEKLIEKACAKIGGHYRPRSEHSHGQWIESLLHISREPFWICDTDIVFFESVEDWFAERNDVLFAGRYEPEFIDPWTGAVHVERLHPSLMWFNTNALRASMRAWPGLNPFLHTVQSNLIQWNMVPRKGQASLFYDTCAGLYHAVGGTQFTEAQNRAFGHLYAGTYADLLAKDGVSLNLLPWHKAVCEKPERAGELLEQQRDWYLANGAYGKYGKKKAHAL